MPKTLLLADDSVVIQKLVGLSFANEDVKLITTDNGNDAIEMARERKPDVVLADVVMPGRSGYEVCEAIKGDPELAHIPVVLLTGTFEAFDEARATAAGSNGHITKPFEAQALVERVNELLREAAAAPPPAPAAEPLEVFGDSDARIGQDVTRASEPPLAAPPAPVATRDPLSADDGFDFGDDIGEALPALDEDDPLADSIDLDDGPSPGEPTIALMPDADDDWLATSAPPAQATPAGAPTPPMAPPAAGQPATTGQPPVPIGRVTPQPTQATPPAAPVTPPAAPVTPPAAPVTPPSAPVTPPSAPVTPPPAPAAPPAAPEAPRPVQATPPAMPTPQPAAAPTPPPPVPNTDATPPLADVSPAAAPVPPPIPTQPPSASPGPDLDAAGAGAEDPSLTTIIMSDGDRSRDGLALGEPMPAVRSLDDEPSVPAAGAEDPNDRTMLADDLFGETGRSDDSDSSFDFGASDLPGRGGASAASGSLAGLDPDPLLDSDPFLAPSATSADARRSGAPDVASRYDVSTSELVEPEDDATGLAEPGGFDLGSPEPRHDIELTDGLLGASMEPSEPPVPAPEPSRPAASPAEGATPDITPVMRDRIHDTLERVAWEAFADLPDTLIKQVVERVEAIAWEVIPQMAEALVKEEIRRMKGESEDD